MHAPKYSVTTSENGCARIFSLSRTLASTALATRKQSCVRGTAASSTKARGKSSRGSTEATGSLTRSFRLSRVGPLMSRLPAVIRSQPLDRREAPHSRRCSDEIRQRERRSTIRYAFSLPVDLEPAGKQDLVLVPTHAQPAHGLVIERLGHEYD